MDVPMLIILLKDTANEKSGVTRLVAAIADSPNIFPIMIVSESSIRYSIPMEMDAVSKSVLNFPEQNDFLLLSDSIIFTFPFYYFIGMYKYHWKTEIQVPVFVHLSIPLLSFLSLE